MKGGYRIINFKQAALTSGKADNIAGTYAAASNPHGKATLISGLIVGDVVYPEFFAPFVSNAGTMESTVVIGGSSITIAITAGDDVTITVKE